MKFLHLGCRPSCKCLVNLPTDICLIPVMDHPQENQASCNHPLNGFNAIPQKYRLRILHEEPARRMTPLVINEKTLTSYMLVRVFSAVPREPFLYLIISYLHVLCKTFCKSINSLAVIFIHPFAFTINHTSHFTFFITTQPDGNYSLNVRFHRFRCFYRIV